MDIFTDERMYKIVVIVLVGYPLLYLVAHLAGRSIKSRYDEHTAKLIHRSILILGCGVLTVDLLREFDFKLTALLGSAGIAGMAIGFALKTSVSNIISGLFVTLEAPFAVGDYIELEDHKGTVLSFDLLSVKICSLSNDFIRIPNEKLLKSNVINHSKYPVKRLTIPLRFPYNQHHDQIYELVERVVTTNPYCLSKPEYKILFTAFEKSVISCDVHVFINSVDYVDAKNSVANDLHQAFLKEEIHMGHSEVSLKNASDSDSITVKLFSGE